ncbi:MAG: hypothetical protein LC657_06955 [Desulfobacteraceae bacterium]|nr:hypothetical protein [Desulfobacteraceae bacterium]
MMVAEKACDLILGNTMEPPSTAPFYRHEKKFTREYDDLDSLFGRWSQQEFQTIQGRIDEERAIDSELWK